MKKKDKLALWKTRIESCKNSGQKVIDWCAENNISKHAYYYWHRKVMDMETVKEASLPAFAQVLPKETVRQCEQTTNPELIVTWRKVSITVTDQQAIPMVAELLTRLESSC